MQFTNIRFADDILAVAKSMGDLREMLSLLIPELAAVGLDLNIQKCKVLVMESYYYRENVSSIL